MWVRHFVVVCLRHGVVIFVVVDRDYWDEKKSRDNRWLWCDADRCGRFVDPMAAFLSKFIASSKVTFIIM